LLSVVASAEGRRLSDQPVCPGYLYVDRKGHRFVDESRVEAHTACQLPANYDPPSLDHPRLPLFAVFDEENFTSGPLGISMFS
jgi:hypothetical protein